MLQGGSSWRRARKRAAAWGARSRMTRRVSHQEPSRQAEATMLQRQMGGMFASGKKRGIGKAQEGGKAAKREVNPALRASRLFCTRSWLMQPVRCVCPGPP